MILQTQSPFPAAKSLYQIPSQHQPQFVNLVYSNRIIRVSTDDIIWLEGSGNYTFIYTKDKRRYLMARTLKTFQEELGDIMFLRIHKSYVVNVTHIRHMDLGDNAFVEMIGGKTLAIARRRINDTLQHYTKHWQRISLN